MVHVATFCDFFDVCRSFVISISFPLNTTKHSCTAKCSRADRQASSTAAGSDSCNHGLLACDTSQFGRNKPAASIFKRCMQKVSLFKH